MIPNKYAVYSSFPQFPFGQSIHEIICSLPKWQLFLLLFFVPYRFVKLCSFHESHQLYSSCISWCSFGGKLFLIPYPSTALEQSNLGSFLTHTSYSPAHFFVHGRVVFSKLNFFNALRIQLLLTLSFCLCKFVSIYLWSNWSFFVKYLSLIHIWRCRRSTLCRSRWSPYH